MGDVIEFVLRKSSRRFDAMAENSEIPPEFRGPLEEFKRLTADSLKGLDDHPIRIGPGMSLTEIGGSVEEAVAHVTKALRSLEGHLFLALVEIDWMRTKRSFLPEDLRADWGRIILAAASADGDGES